jgi:hypothetical protein
MALSNSASKLSAKSERLSNSAKLFEVISIIHVWFNYAYEFNLLVRYFSILKHGKAVS